MIEKNLGGGIGTLDILKNGQIKHLFAMLLPHPDSNAAWAMTTVLLNLAPRASASVQACIILMTNSRLVTSIAPPYLAFDSRQVSGHLILAVLKMGEILLELLEDDRNRLLRLLVPLEIPQELALEERESSVYLFAPGPPNEK